MKWPFLKFYTRDWQSDTELRMCSLEARGYWFECLCIMHNAKRRGYLESPNGAPLDESQRLRLMGTFKGEAERCESELLQHGVPSIEEETGIWYCRRMVKETAKAEKCSKAGKKGGGSPILTTNTINTEVPETRNHISLKGTFKGQEDKPRQKSLGFTYSEDFLQFWEAYPKKHGKGAAFKSWQKARCKPPVKEIVDSIAIQRRSSQWLKDNGQYIPHPSTWINQRCWEDEPETVDKQERPRQRIIYSDAQIFHDWDNMLKIDFTARHGISHADFADRLRIDLVDMKKEDFGKKYKATADNVRELLNNYGY